MKKIAYVMNEFPHLSETFIGTEMRAMQQQGHTITPFALGKTNGLFQPIDADLASQTQHLSQISRRQALAFLFNHARGIKRTLPFLLRQTGFKKASLLLHAARLALLIQQHGCQHIHAHFAQASTSFAIVAARLLNISVSFVGHGHDIYAHPVDLDLKLRYCDLAIAVCQDMLNLFKQINYSTRSALVYCGVDAERFQGKGGHLYNKRLLFIGRLCEKKGLDHLIYALNEIPAELRPEVDVVGDGPLKAAWQALITHYALHDYIHLLGPKPSEWFIEHHSDYAALIAPFREAKNGDRDTGPIVLKEAMALGLPVITTAFMGCNEIVDEHCGIKVEPNNIHALAQGICQFFEYSTEQRLTMHQQARERLRTHFGSHAQAQRLSALIEGLPL